MPLRSAGARVAMCLGLIALSGCAAPNVDELASGSVRVEALPCGKSGVGSGSVINGGLVLTNAHIVAGSTDDVTIRTWDDRLLDGLVVGFDSERDLALIKVEGLDIEGFDLAEPVEGEAVRILARPGGPALEVLDATILRLINATGDDIYAQGDVSRGAMELSVDARPGVSGGAVVNEDGQMVGIMFADSRNRADVSYAVDSQEVRAFVAETDPDIPADTLRCRN